VLVGDAVRRLDDFLPFFREHELGEEQRRCGCGAYFDTPIEGRLAERG